MTLIPRLAEALDTELIRQKLASQWVIDLDPESLAVAAINDLADRIEGEGWISCARWLRYQLQQMEK